MTEELGLVAYEKVQRSFLGDMPQIPYATERSYSEATAREIDATVKNIVDAAFRRTVNLLRAQRETLERGARLLLERETLDETDLTALLRSRAAIAGRLGSRAEPEELTEGRFPVFLLGRYCIVRPFGRMIQFPINADARCEQIGGRGRRRPLRARHGRTGPG